MRGSPTRPGSQETLQEEQPPGFGEAALPAYRKSLLKAACSRAALGPSGPGPKGEVKWCCFVSCLGLNTAEIAGERIPALLPKSFFFLFTFMKWE